ncbi:MAG: hypothetical protein MR936_14970 [Eubacterium sp.]|nr:hypothetical protein [Eubacterium sp.]
MNKLKSLVDTDVYIKLLVILAGETVYFPATGTPNEKADRNKAIRNDYKNGMSYEELHDLYGLSISQIRRICKE